MEEDREEFCGIVGPRESERSLSGIYGQINVCSKHLVIYSTRVGRRVAREYDLIHV